MFAGLPDPRHRGVCKKGLGLHGNSAGGAEEEEENCIGSDWRRWRFYYDRGKVLADNQRLDRWREKFVSRMLLLTVAQTKTSSSWKVQVWGVVWLKFSFTARCRYSNYRMKEQRKKNPSEASSHIRSTVYHIIRGQTSNSNTERRRHNHWQLQLWEKRINRKNPHKTQQRKKESSYLSEAPSTPDQLFIIS